MRISAIATGHFGHRDRGAPEPDGAPFRHRCSTRLLVISVSCRYRFFVKTSSWTWYGALFSCDARAGGSMSAALWSLEARRGGSATSALGPNRQQRSPGRLNRSKGSSKKAASPIAEVGPCSTPLLSMNGLLAHSRQCSATHPAGRMKRQRRLRRPASASGGLHSPWKITMRAPSGTKGTRQ